MFSNIDELLTRYSEVLRLESPAKRTVEAIDDYITKRELYGHRLQAMSATKKKNLPYPDLVRLAASVEDDGLAKLFANFLPWPFVVINRSLHISLYISSNVSTGP